MLWPYDDCAEHDGRYARRAARPAPLPRPVHAMQGSYLVRLRQFAQIPFSENVEGPHPTIGVGNISAIRCCFGAGDGAYGRGRSGGVLRRLRFSFFLSFRTGDPLQGKPHGGKN